VAIDDLTKMLDAIALQGPSQTVPKLLGMPLDDRTALLGQLYKKGWITAHVFHGEDVGAGQMLDLTSSGRAELQSRWDAQDAAIEVPVGVTIDERRDRRTRYLKSLYEMSGGDPSTKVSSPEIGKQLGWPELETAQTARDLRVRGCIAYLGIAPDGSGIGPLVCLTEKGLDEAESALLSQPLAPAAPAAPGAVTDRQFMERAVVLAHNCVSEPDKVSPLVGAVVARHGVLLGEAYRGELKPGEHAEYTLLERKLPHDTLAGSTIFTTLEPCTDRNHPKLPCVERIIERRVRRVFIGTLDPNDSIRGRGQLRLRDAGIEVQLFDPDLMAELEELNREFSRQHVGARGVERTPEQLAEPGGQLGPNGHPIAYNNDGDKVELLPDEDNPGDSWSLILRRSDQKILDAYNRIWDQVWWNRHQAWKNRIESGDETLTPVRQTLYMEAEQKAAEIEARYPNGELELDDFDWGLLSGRMSALAWVMGAEWNESLDT
jgi:pyrimidine deaminase RibD-like protein